MPCDHKMLSVVGIVRKRVEPRHMTHHVDQPKMTLISKSFTNPMINQQLQLQEWQLIHLYRFICRTIIPMSQYLRRVLHNHFYVNGQNFITRVWHNPSYFESEIVYFIYCGLISITNFQQGGVRGQRRRGKVGQNGDP